jgi:predicted nucleotidyltransferase
MAYIFENFEPFGVIVTGSIIRGNPDPSSDFDILVLHAHSWRRRVQRFFEGVPAEIFVNSPAWIERYLAEEAVDGRPIFAHMLTTGAVVFSSSAKTGEIIEMARASLEKGANFSSFALQQRRYSAACLFEDAFDMAERDEVAATLILGRAIEAAVGYWFASRQRFSVRSKEQLDVLRKEAPETGKMIEQALLGSSMELRVEAAHRLAQTVIGHAGFFEWDSGPSEMT